MPSRSSRSTRASTAGRRSAATPVAGLPTTAAEMRSGRLAAACSAIAPPTAIPASATLPVMPQRIDQRRQIVHHRVDGKHASRLLRQPGAARVVAQHAPFRGEPRHHLVPALQAAAHLVDQHDRPLAAARQLVAQADAVGLDEVHAAIPRQSLTLRYQIPRPLVAEQDVAENHAPSLRSTKVRVFLRQWEVSDAAESRAVFGGMLLQSRPRHSHTALNRQKSGDCSQRSQGWLHRARGSL